MRSIAVDLPEFLKNHFLILSANANSGIRHGNADEFTLFCIMNRYADHPLA